jgi:hypothetical protein
MRTIKVIRKKEELGQLFADYMNVVQENDMVEIVIRYRLKQPILLKKGTKREYPIYASPNHPKSKAIHELIVRVDVDPPKHHRRFPFRSRPLSYQIRHHRSERKKK